MNVSWNTIGYWVKTGTVLFPVALVLFLLENRFGGNLVSIAKVVTWSALGVIGISCGGIALLHYAGWLKITCPLCKRPALVISRGFESALRYKSCGIVHARGFFRMTYEQRQPRDAE